MFRFIIDFCALGFIGKMFKTVDLPLIGQFLLIFYKDKPGEELVAQRAWKPGRVQE